MRAAAQLLRNATHVGGPMSDDLRVRTMTDDPRTGECICGHPHHSHPLPGRMPGVHCERCYRCTGWRRIDTTFDNGRHNA